eukprot:CAMPEP_0197240698 /NCGR_PEP_ID=MMETSP1429-20130617/6923_1 /TAXON_ID=49237 /ORGANISM="Chaetoceros  sp., Strain UNC1202" /LENGTH=274 /DNA_ID=CAMNT_0042700389 /DNA_START=98 /DNA_END=919 /DNA_ORIENTATION=+
MSRGYLKNQGRKVGRKVARGGSSARSRRNKLSDDDQPKNKSCRSGGGRGSKGAGRRCTSTTDCDDYYADDYYFDDYDYGYDYIGDYDYGYDYIGDYECDDEIEQPHTQDVVARTGEQECSICCEVRPLVSLFRKCKHPPTCRECLREIYVNQAQEDVSNYPLRCFYPSCKRSVRGAQLIRHNLVRSDDELQRHYRLDVLQKHYRIQKSYARGVNIVHCPDCDFPRSVRENRSVVHCNQCKVSFAVAHHNVTNIMTTITAVEGIANDAFGINDGW